MKLNEVLPDNWRSSGLFFTVLSRDYILPWSNDGNFDALFMDIQFIALYGSRDVSALISLIIGESGQLTDENITAISKSIYAMFHTQWENLYKTFNIVAVPASNTDITETTESASHVKNDIFGYNSATGAGANSADGSGNATITRTGFTGVSQSELLDKARETWRYNYFMQVFNDIKNITTIPYYGGY